jgi:hypothetical protein
MIFFEQKITCLKYRLEKYKNITMNEVWRMFEWFWGNQKKKMV